MSEANGEQIHDPVRIARLLGRIVRARSTLAVHAGKQHTEALSALLAASSSPPGLQLDAFSDPVRHKGVAAGTRLHVSTRLDGVTVRFECEVTAVDSDTSGALYRTTLPALVHYEERRGTLRVEPLVRPHLHVTLTGGEHGFRTELINLSLNGLGLSAQADLAGSYEVGDRIALCTIALPDGGVLEGQLEVCHITPMATRRENLLGARFIDLLPASQQTLQEFLFELQRQALQLRREEPPG